MHKRLMHSSLSDDIKEKILTLLLSDQKFLELVQSSREEGPEIDGRGVQQSWTRSERLAQERYRELAQRLWPPDCAPLEISRFFLVIFEAAGGRVSK